MGVILGQLVVDKLIAAGLVPEECTRVVIDMRAPRVVEIHYTTMADQRLLGLDWEEFIKVTPSVK